MADIKISEMTPGSALGGTEKFEAVQSAATVYLTSLQVKTYVNQAIYQFNEPITGFSLAVTTGTQVVILKPAGTIATGTLTLPANPLDGDRVRFSTTNTITAFTLAPSAGQSVANAITTIAANGFAEYIYRVTDTTWYRIG